MATALELSDGCARYFARIVANRSAEDSTRVIRWALPWRHLPDRLGPVVAQRLDRAAQFEHLNG
jgi:hypothetical protein